MTDAITLQLVDPDSIRCLRRALDNGALSYQVMAIQANESSMRELKDKRAREAQRHERRAAEYLRRETLTRQLLDQLPTDTAPLLAPMGE